MQLEDGLSEGDVTQLQWLKSRMKEAAPQALVIAR